jgi:hypothetical protein
VSRPTPQPSVASASHAAASPSAWSRRAPVVALALTGCAVALYLALFQLGVTGSVWDPLFGRGPKVLLTPSLSPALLVPDAMLGLLAYRLDAVLGALGGEQRWRTAPRLVPGLADRLAARVAWEGQMHDGPEDPSRPDNLLEPVPGHQGAHGAFDARASDASVELWATTHAGWPASGAVGALGAVAAALAALKGRR